jgi:hypothetical protein
VLPALVPFVIWLARAGVAQAAPVAWIGLTRTFTKLAGTAPESNQDVLISGVALSRGLSGGLINVGVDTFYDPAVSPKFTEWATDLNNPGGASITATNGPNLSYSSWINAFGGQHTAGSLIANRDAVVHLIAADIYLELKFTSWTPVQGNGFAYMRAEPPGVPIPTGDYNGDNEVDAADYVVWRNTFGLSADPHGSGADGNGNGMIDDGDYTFWLEKFGNAVPAASASIALQATPEPATILLLLLGWWIVTLYVEPREQ